MILAALLLQATVVPDVPQRFSILSAPQCVKEAPDSDIIVCANAQTDSPRLPLRDDRGPPDRPIPSNPNLTGVGALAATATPCAATQWGCQVGFGPPIAPIINGAVGLAKSALARKPDRTGRIAIPLDDAPPTPEEPAP